MNDKISKQWESKLTTIAETSIAHMKGLELKQEAGEDIHAEDFGILALERGFLVLYGLYVKGEIPDFANEYLNSSKVN